MQILDRGHPSVVMLLSDNGADIVSCDIQNSAPPLHITSCHITLGSYTSARISSRHDTKLKLIWMPSAMSVLSVKTYRPVLDLCRHQAHNGGAQQASGAAALAERKKIESSATHWQTSPSRWVVGHATTRKLSRTERARGCYGITVNLQL
jgi:hypothetical protein